MNMTDIRDKVAEQVISAHSIAWDECHKIYILMDEGQTEQMKQYEYPFVFTRDYPIDFLETLLGWYEDSCSLRFITRVETESDGTDKFVSIVGQFD
jgi:hypothetical protein